MGHQLHRHVTTTPEGTYDNAERNDENQMQGQLQECRDALRAHSARLMGTYRLPTAQIQTQMGLSHFRLAVQVLDHFCGSGGIVFGAIERIPGVFFARPRLAGFVQRGNHKTHVAVSKKMWRRLCPRGKKAVPTGFDDEKSRTTLATQERN
ncbi:MAG: hypothetical protein IPH26_09280 [Sterolibacteriaceae bacterium]|uniref:Uncharacterized protein n=1 Tax=Candidatus Methylophosphatis roskildensis TaxID=2899263 RepID=A0A9D7E592_9PROT|nr:hypothetical protein [Candidatus Methylophosphatis roskildensis]